MRRFSPVGAMVGGAVLGLFGGRCPAEGPGPRAILKAHVGPVYSLAFSPDGKALATVGGDQTIRMWDIVAARPRAGLEWGAGEAFAVAFSPDGKAVATGDRGWVRLCDASSGKRRLTFTGHHKFVRCVAFSPDGKMVASGGDDYTVKVWGATTGRELRTLQGRDKALSAITSLVFSPDGKALACGGWDGRVRLWDTTSGRERATLTGHTEAVRSVAFSPDGGALASGGDDKAVRLWAVATGKQKAVLSGHKSFVLAVAFSPDGKVVASGESAGVVRLWDIPSGAQQATLAGQAGGVLAVAFSPDGKTLASGSEDGTVKLWDIAAAIKAGAPPPPPVRPRPALPPARPKAQEQPPGPGDALMRWLRIHEAWGLPRPRSLDWLVRLERLLLFVSDFCGPERKRGQFVFPWQSKVECLTHFARTGDAYGCEKVLKVSRDGKALAEVMLRRYLEPKKTAEDRLRDFERRYAPVRTGAGGPSLDEIKRRRVAKLNEEVAYWRSVIAARAREEQAFALACRLLRAIRPGPVRTSATPIKGKK